MPEINLDVPEETIIYPTRRYDKEYELTEGDYEYPVTFNVNVPPGRKIRIQIHIQVDEVT